MPKRLTKFSELWLSSLDSNLQRIGEWCRKGGNAYNAYCQFCDAQIRCDNVGRAQLMQHSVKKKCVESTKHSLDKKQTKLVVYSVNQGESLTAPTSKGLGIVIPGDESLKEEILWLAKVASSNFSFRSTDKLGELFRSMFLDSKIATSFSLSHTSSSYIISEGLSPYFTRMIVKDLLKSTLPFSLHFDETSTAQVKN